MLNGWSIPAVWIFVVAQASAAVWWASGTDQQVGNNTSAIVQIAENEKEIAVIEVQQRAIAEDVTEIKEMMVEIRTLILKQ
jgi:hypothetical protein